MASIQKKLIPENDECVDNCSSTVYKYNYNNICYQNCPNRTYNNNYICENCHNDCKTCEKPADDKSTNCLSCSDPNKFLYLGNCVYCNDGYYPKYEDIIKGNSIIECYQTLEGYYLESGYFKPCYKSCQICDKRGDDANHNCKQCKNNFNFEISMNQYKNCFENIMKNSSIDSILDNMIYSYIPENQNVIEILKPDGIIYQITNTKKELELLKNLSNTPVTIPSLEPNYSRKISLF